MPRRSTRRLLDAAAGSGSGHAAVDATRAAADLAVRPMQVDDLDAVMAVETACYPFPWTRGNFIDSIAAGYPARLLLDDDGLLLGYVVAMPGVDEMHLLNITVAPHAQGRGHASRLVGVLRALCVEARAAQLWLEVRQSNVHAQAVYRHLGFLAIGVRKGYYPAAFGRREDAVVMSLTLAAGGTGGASRDALV